MTNFYKHKKAMYELYKVKNMLHAVLHIDIMTELFELAIMFIPRGMMATFGFLLTSCTY